MAASDVAAADVAASDVGAPIDGARGRPGGPVISANDARHLLDVRAAGAGAASAWNRPVASGRGGASAAALGSPAAPGADAAATRGAAAGEQRQDGETPSALVRVLDRLQPRPAVREAAPAAARTPLAPRAGHDDGAGAAEGAAAASSGLRRLLALAPTITAGGPPRVRPPVAGGADGAEATPPSTDRDRPAGPPLQTERTLPPLLVERLQDDRLAERLERILRAEARRQGVDLDGVLS
jgi:hypothetical protein